MWTVPRVLVRRTASPAHADFGGLSSLAALVVVRLDVVPPPRSSRRRWRVVGWADILLDVIGGVESALREGCPGTMTGVSQYWFSGHFRQVFSTLIHYPALTLAPTCAGARLLCTSDGVCMIVYVQFSPVGAGMVWGGGLLFILGSNLGGVGPERGLRGGGRRGWCEEWARSG
jgi:hypothetical protein